VAPNTLVFFEPNGLEATTQQTALEKPAGAGLVFAPHYYQASAALGNPVVKGVAADLQKWADLGAKWSVPVFVGEFGVGNDAGNAEAFMRAHFDALDATGMHGTEWEYSASADIWNGETLSLTDAKEDELPVAKAIQRPYPRAVAGSGVTFSYDTDKKL